MIAIGITVFISLVSGSLWAYAIAASQADETDELKSEDEESDKNSVFFSEKEKPPKKSGFFLGDK